MSRHNKSKRRGYRSLFWPMLLIGVGTAWILSNVGIFSADNIAVAFQLWPLIFIGIGLDMLFGRSSPTRGATIGLAFVGFVLAIMYVGPSMGIGKSEPRTNTNFDIPIDGSQSLELNINAGIDTVTLNPLIDSNNLIEGDIWHYGEITIDEENRDNIKVMSIHQNSFDFAFNFGSDSPEESGWSFLVSPDRPLSLDFEGGVGSAIMDLRAFELLDVNLDMGVGEMEVQLPEPQQDYAVDINGGIGQVILDFPDNVAVQLDVSTGIGQVKMPTGYIQIEGDDGMLGEEGVWQTPDFDQAEHQVFVTFDGGVGEFVIR